MDERLKGFMQNLGDAIDESIVESRSIAGAIDAIKKAGYDVFLVLEATIGFNKIADSDLEASGRESGKELPPRISTKVLTKFDQDLLRDMHIKMPENDEPEDPKHKKKKK